MNDLTHHLDELEAHDTWPAFVDLFAATSLLFITFVGVFIYVAAAQQGAVSTTRRKILEELVAASRSGQLFTVDSTDRQFVRIVLRERATFPVGKYKWETLRDSGKTALTQIGTVLNGESFSGLYREVRVLGHTDQIPFVSAGFTNWELSAARAAVVARYLVNWVRVDPCKISATGRGPYFPIDGRDMEANRRIEIQILPRLENDAAQERETCLPVGDGTRAYAAGVLEQRALQPDSALVSVIRSAPPATSAPLRPTLAPVASPPVGVPDSARGEP